jgi:hypothetical protein
MFGFAHFLKLEFGLREDVVFVVDGESSAEKDAASKSRQSVTEKQLNKLRALLADTNFGSRVTRSKWRLIEKLLQSTFFIKKEYKAVLSQVLSEVGLNVICAPFEADVYIGKQLDCAFVISRDSDLIFHTHVSLMYSSQVTPFIDIPAKD